MGREARPVPENGDMEQDDQAALIRSTGDGVAPENEAELLAEEWGAIDPYGVYAGPAAEAREVFVGAGDDG
jgi:hypothetical protein